MIKMVENKKFGKIISGSFNKVIIREKNNAGIELGDLLIARRGKSKILLRVYDLMYGSQLSQQALELISGIDLEGENELDFYDKEVRTYNLAVAENLLEIKDEKVNSAKKLPEFMSSVRLVREEDMKFLSNKNNNFFIGKLRSGSKELNLDIKLDASKILKHHILIAATTGRGKSNLAKVIISNLIKDDSVGVLVLDPHDEYYGRNSFGIKDYARINEDFVYYSPTKAPQYHNLKINIETIRPSYLNIDWSSAQNDTIYLYYRRKKQEWIKAILTDEFDKNEINEATMTVIRRKLQNLLGLKVVNGKIISESIFTTDGAKNTIKEIIGFLEEGKTVIIDTSSLSSDVELLVGSMITSSIMNRYKYYKTEGALDKKPTISILLEEAPRVLNNESLQKKNIFSTIAREGRKFKIGLIAITQLPSLIPREILANMNTKIILGIEMEQERQAIINSASQDLSTSSKSIASLDVGEAIVTSSFTKFAIPIKIPEYKEHVKEKEEKEGQKNNHSNEADVKTEVYGFS